MSEVIERLSVEDILESGSVVMDAESARALGLGVCVPDVADVDEPLAMEVA